jgi:uncharacterized protein (TIGR00661 family)
MGDPVRTVLVCPLDWGIGHATRCVPVIRKFMEQGFRVVIAADGRPLEFLKKEFPELKCIRFPGSVIRYRAGSSQKWGLLLQLPGFLRNIRKEHRALRKLVREENADVVVSDNRYGLWSKECRSVFITHQLELQLPGGLRWLSPFTGRFIRRYAGKYDECWIPDFENHEGLAGRLSHPARIPSNAVYIGTLSRFSVPRFTDEPFERSGHEILVLLSGPEPQRTILEEKLLKQLKQTDLKAIMVRGLTERSDVDEADENIRIYSHPVTPKLRNFLSEALVVICRPGYSSIMDVVSMGKRAVFIPTPGQTEQEYLARYLMDRKIFLSIGQDQFDLIYALELSKNFPGMVLENDYSVLTERIARITK